MGEAPKARVRAGQTRGPVLVGRRPGVGVIAASVPDFDAAVKLALDWYSAADPAVRPTMEWWIELDTLPVWGGSEVMAAEQKAYREAHPPKGRRKK